MTTHTDRIRQMAQEAGLAWIGDDGLPHPIIIDYIDLTPNLARFAQIVAEDCARVCDSEPERQRGDGVYAADQGACAQAIRARYSLKD